MFVGVEDGARLISYDGVTWTGYIAPPVINYGTAQPGIAYGAGMFLTFGTNNEKKASYILKSTNGTGWTTIYTSSNCLFAAAYGNNTWVFIGTNEIVTATMTSSNWNWTEFQPGFSPCSIAYGNGTFVIAPYGHYYSSPSAIFSSSDGIAWQYKSTLAGGLNPSIAYGNRVFVVTGDDYNDSLPGGPYIFNVFVSSNLVNWTQNTICESPQRYVSHITYGGNQFVGYFGASVWTSTNSLDWTNRITDIWTSTFAYGEGTFVVADVYGNIFQSGEFASPSNSASTTLAISTYPGVTINGTAGTTYQIQYTTNLNSTWLPLTNFYLPYSPYLWIDTSSIISGQKFYRSVQFH